MTVSLDVAMSAQLSLMKRLETIAHNVANASTVGFRSEEINFSQLVSSNTLTNTAFSQTGETVLSQKAGALVKTDGALDLAVNGNAWFAIQTPAGLVNTRDGRLQMLETGELRTLNGYPILDVGGAPISLDQEHIARLDAHAANIHAVVAAAALYCHHFYAVDLVQLELLDLVADQGRVRQDHELE